MVAKKRTKTKKKKKKEERGKGSRRRKQRREKEGKTKGKQTKPPAGVARQEAQAGQWQHRAAIISLVVQAGVRLRPPCVRVHWSVL